MRIKENKNEILIIPSKKKHRYLYFYIFKDIKNIIIIPTNSE